MSVNANEPAQGQVPEGHPAWQDILGVIPEDLQALVKPKLEEWDKGVQAKLQAVQSQYDPYKPYLERDPQDLQNAISLMEQMQQDPESVIQQAIDFFELSDKFRVNAAGEVEEVEENELGEMGIDVLKDPRIKALVDNYEKMNQKLTEREQKELADKQTSELETLLTGLETEHGKFDRLYVTALMSNGVDAEAAVKTYFDTINAAVAQHTQQQNPAVPPPVVMGGDGQTGSGIPNQPVELGKMKNTEVTDLVSQFIQRANEQST